VRVYVKGAPEEVIPLCDRTLDVNIQTKKFTQDDKDALLIEHDMSSQNINTMASEGLKVLTYAFKEIPMEELKSLYDRLTPETDEFRDEIEENLIYVCTFGMDDPLYTDI